MVCHVRCFFFLLPGESSEMSPEKREDGDKDINRRAKFVPVTHLIPNQRIKMEGEGEFEATGPTEEIKEHYRISFWLS